MQKSIFSILLAMMALTANGKPHNTQMKPLKTVYIGTFMNDPGGGIYSCLYDPQTGALSDMRLEKPAIQSSFLAVSKDKKQVYSFRTGDDGLAMLLSFKIADDGRTLIPVDSIPTGAVDPCHIKLLDNDRIAAAACYQDGKVVYCKTDENGKFIGPVETIDHNKTQEKSEKQVSHAHQINTDLKGKYIYVTDLGLDRIVVYTIDNGKLKETARISATPGSGPRHTAFSPTGKYMALVAELNGTVSIYKKDKNGIFSEKIQTESLLPQGYTGRASSADIHYSTDGKTLYVSERGSNGVIIYDANPQSGNITECGRITDSVKIPRNFYVDGNGKWLIVGNQEANNIATYGSAPGSGPVSHAEAFKPCCILVLD